jgi:uncharacterized protein YdeI (YjbR/CyaY-like superfamily)
VETTETIELASLDLWTSWLRTHGAERDQVWVVIFKKASGKQVVGFDELLEEALCWGWVDTQTKGVDELRYRIRFRKRRPGSNWSITNRSTVCRLIAASRMQPMGRDALPADLMCPD